ncbi:hypothetical protein F3Y22_tig00110831pilonHSYRG00456 [Hibiscus syriacus]|uniref:Reverse transcriptase Ty1/copia-type domain-containing protein n=1 Tax=Hibiscus syriacus TaxID=106335 RepID=A0A6A2ZMI3_HIBSY|nr:hypothetical protein F3Y22_tig00110831pilonHSYRG00456 [Hibiscus syriacus]
MVSLSQKLYLTHPRPILSRLRDLLSPVTVAALRDPNWKLAMTDEYDALIKNKTWDLIPRPPRVNVIHSMWIFTHKIKSDGSFERHKAHLVGDGKTQRVVLIVERLSVRKSDTSLFLYKQGSDMAYLLLYVDDIILMASSEHLRKSIMAHLNFEFAMKDLPSQTPVDTKPKVSTTSGARYVDPTQYRTLRPTLSRSSVEAEYRGVANVVSESCWLRNLLLELNCHIRKATMVYCDNVSAINLSGNPIKHQRTKHIKMDIHFVREKDAQGEVRVRHVPSRYHIADIFTKGLPLLFDDFRTSLNVRDPPVSTAGGVIDYEIFSKYFVFMCI